MHLLPVRTMFRDEDSIGKRLRVWWSDARGCRDHWWTGGSVAFISPAFICHVRFHAEARRRRAVTRGHTRRTIHDVNDHAHDTASAPHLPSRGARGRGT